MRAFFVRVYVRVLFVRFLVGFFVGFLESFFRSAVDRITFVGALSGVPNRLFCFADTFVDEVSCTTSVPTLQVPHCACVDKILPSKYVCVILVNTTRNINEFLNNTDCVVCVSDCEKNEFFLLHVGVSSVGVLVIGWVSDVFIVTLLVYVLLLVFLPFTGLYCTLYGVLR